MNLHENQPVNTSLSMFLFQHLFGTKKNRKMNLAEIDDCKMSAFSIVFPLEHVLLSPDLLLCEKTAYVYHCNPGGGGAFTNIMGATLIQ